MRVTNNLRCPHRKLYCEEIKASVIPPMRDQAMFGKGRRQARGDSQVEDGKWSSCLSKDDLFFDFKERQ